MIYIFAILAILLGYLWIKTQVLNNRIIGINVRLRKQLADWRKYANELQEYAESLKTIKQENNGELTSQLPVNQDKSGIQVSEDELEKWIKQNPELQRINNIVNEINKVGANR